MKLVILVKTIGSGGQNQKVVEAKGSYCTVGREGCQVILNDPKCSRQHLILFEEADGSLWIRDLESSNGTYLEDERIEKSPLKIGDEFRVGTTRLEVLSFHPTDATRERGSAYTVRDNVLPKSVPHREAEEEQTSTQQILKVVSRWPDNMACVPKEKQSDFAQFLDSKSKKIKVNSGSGTPRKGK